MTPHPDLTQAQRREMVKWILSQGAASGPAQAEAKLYSYPLRDGSTAQLDFPMFVEGKPGKVTKDVFHGYQLYNSYCYRCHGTDATESKAWPGSATQSCRRDEAAGLSIRGDDGPAGKGDARMGRLP